MSPHSTPLSEPPLSEYNSSSDSSLFHADPHPLLSFVSRCRQKKQHVLVSRSDRHLDARKYGEIHKGGAGV